MAEKLFGLLVFGMMALVLGLWTLRDLRRGETIIDPPIRVSKLGNPAGFWVQICVQAALAAASLFGAVKIAFG
jgi:hypothetical protein